jgi:hypothetical protein
MDSGVPKDLYVELITTPPWTPSLYLSYIVPHPKRTCHLPHTPQQSLPEYLHVAEAQTRTWTRSLYPIGMMPHRKRRMSTDVPRNLHVNLSTSPDMATFGLPSQKKEMFICHLPHPAHTATVVRKRRGGSRRA